MVALKKLSEKVVNLCKEWQNNQWSNLSLSMVA
jgi:hypothetical protein